MLQGGANSRQLIRRQRLLDEHEQLAFLQPNVSIEHDTQLVKQCKLRRWVAGKLVHPPPKRDVITQRTRHEGMMSITVRGVGGKQHLLLKAKVRAARGRPVVESVAKYRGLRLGGGPTQPLRDRQRPVMVARQRDQRRVALHVRRGPTAGRDSILMPMCRPGTRRR